MQHVLYVMCLHNEQHVAFYYSTYLKDVWTVEKITLKTIILYDFFLGVSFVTYDVRCYCGGANYKNILLLLILRLTRKYRCILFFVSRWKN